MKEWEKPEVKNLGIDETRGEEIACALTSDVQPLYDIPYSDYICGYKKDGKCTHPKYNQRSFWYKGIYFKNVKWPCPKSDISDS